MNYSKAEKFVIRSSIQVLSKTPSVRLFCFHNAGGGASAYRDWATHFPPEIEILAIQLPGRESRISKPPYHRMKPLLADLCEELQDYLDLPFSFFGHSMGASIAYELSHLLRNQRLRQPIHLFVSGRRAPHCQQEETKKSELQRSAFIEMLRDIGGTPKEVFESDEMLDLLIPTLKADLEILDTLAYTERPPLDLPINAYGGDDDCDVSSESIEAWSKHTSASFRSKIFPGGHFYLREFMPILVADIIAALSPLQTNIFAESSDGS